MGALGNWTPATRPGSLLCHAHLLPLTPMLTCLNGTDWRTVRGSVKRPCAFMNRESLPPLPAGRIQGMSTIGS